MSGISCGILRNLRRERKNVSSINGTRDTGTSVGVRVYDSYFFFSPFAFSPQEVPTEIHQASSTNNSHPSTHFTFYALRTSKLQIMQMVRQHSAIKFNNKKRM